MICRKQTIPPVPPLPQQNQQKAEGWSYQQICKLSGGLVYPLQFSFSSSHLMPSLNHLTFPSILQQEMKTDNLSQAFFISVIWCSGLVHMRCGCISHSS